MSDSEGVRSDPLRDAIYEIALKATRVGPLLNAEKLCDRIMEAIAARELDETAAAGVEESAVPLKDRPVAAEQGMASYAVDDPYEILRRVVVLAPSAEPGNGPGHCHENPPLWDDDNGDKSGTVCDWCVAWASARELVVPSPQPETEQT